MAKGLKADITAYNGLNMKQNALITMRWRQGRRPSVRVNSHLSRR